MSGKHICSYVITAQYDGKKPFCIGTFHVEKGRTEQETEEAAGRLLDGVEHNEMPVRT